ncbi:hypothetical protein CROQUDRAFT_95421 [Cronartium quercuum f. sp. fusiforme G11]|uniref:Uncharacterized protein n=1 Tax=Cronartium quercuum f. sp. fusiforme G11 TaxID=708437 RepID=A0A9P6NIA0_9BASI|nr:hypothetical protein CROQUDRAFT_95421 [Cronartium quercuum f. sp. fusiforme G11]
MLTVGDSSSLWDWGLDSRSCRSSESSRRRAPETSESAWETSTSVDSPSRRGAGSEASWEVDLAASAVNRRVDGIWANCLGVQRGRVGTAEMPFDRLEGLLVVKNFFKENVRCKIWTRLPQSQAGSHDQIGCCGKKNRDPSIDDETTYGMKISE